VSKCEENLDCAMASGRPLLGRDIGEAVACALSPVVVGGTLGIVEIVGFSTGLLAGGTVGLVAARLRLRLLAEPSASGIRRRRAGDGESVSAALADLEYPPRYDQWLGAVCLVVGIAALAAIPLFEPGGRLTLYLVAAALVAFVSAGGAIGAASMRSRQPR
jgi:hypothetical protein